MTARYAISRSFNLGCLCVYLYGNQVHANPLQVGGDACAPAQIQSLVQAAEADFQSGDYIESARIEETAARCLESIRPRNAMAWAASLARLAELSRIQGRTKDAESRLRQALAIHERELGGESSEYAALLVGLSTVYADRGRYLDAEARVRKAIDLYGRLPVKDSKGERAAMNALGVLHAGLGDDEGAERVFRRALALPGSGAPDEVTAALLHNLATVRSNMGDLAEAEAEYRDALSLRRGMLPAGHPDISASTNALARVLHRSGKEEQARKLRSRQ